MFSDDWNTSIAFEVDIPLRTNKVLQSIWRLKYQKELQTPPIMLRRSRRKKFKWCWATEYFMREKDANLRIKELKGDKCRALKLSRYDLAPTVRKDR